MATTIDETALFFGAPASLTVGGDEVGATLTAPKVTIEATQYAPEFQGAGGPISGAVFNTKIKAIVSFTVNELTAAKLAWSLPGSTSSAGAGSTVGDAGAFSTTTDLPTLVGTTYLPLTSVASPLAVGQWLKIGAAALIEYRKVREIVPTAGVLLNEALTMAHDSATAVVRTVDGDTTTITWSTGRVPSTAFKDVVLDGVGLDGQHLIVTVTDALSDGKLDVEMSDSAVAGSNVTLTGYYDGANPTLCPVSIAVG
jgi:hypothetical protein